MEHVLLRAGAIALAVLLSIGITSCGGAKVLKKPQLLTLGQPLTTGADSQLEVTLDWVIVRDGPGTWARSADWDQYLLRVRNLSSEPIRINNVIVYDSLGTRLASTAERKRLVAGSRATARRYKGEGIRVKAGAGGPTLVAAGTTAYVAGGALGVAVLAGSASVEAAGVALGAMAVAPVLVVGGMVRSYRNDRVSREIRKRHTVLPVEVLPTEQKQLVAFVPLAPAPRQIEVTYSRTNAERILAVQMPEVLHGLHLGNRQK